MIGKNLNTGVKRNYVITTMLTEARKRNDGTPIMRKTKDGKDRFVTRQVKHWFAGVRPVKLAGASAPMMVDFWETDTSLLRDEEGYFTKDEAKRFLKIINTDGLIIEKIKRP